MSAATLTPDDLTRILTYLSLPPSSELPLAPLPFLTEYLPILPSSLLLPFSSLVPPRQRSSIPLVKSRRLTYASTTPPPPELTANLARRRWPLLWERMGGSSLPPPSGGVEDEERWVEESFLPGNENRQHVKKLGGFLRGLEEEREWEGMAERRRVERGLDVGETFQAGEEDGDEEGEAEDEEARGARERARVLGVVEAEDQEEVKRAFEKKVLELFLDGMDVSYRGHGVGRYS